LFFSAFVVNRNTAAATAITSFVRTSTNRVPKALLCFAQRGTLLHAIAHDSELG
jgi:hypothetical protein